MLKNPQFQVHLLNDEGIAKANELATAFDDLLEGVKSITPEGRELALVKTHLEIASFYAKKGMASDPKNQKAGT